MNDRIKTVIMGAGGRDFHVFNTVYRDRPSHEVVAITAAQIPNIDHRIYPPELSGPLYPDGIPIVPEHDLEDVIRDKAVTEVVFAYSDVPISYLMDMSRRIAKLGVAFFPFDPETTMIRGNKPALAVCAVRTGCGKSALSRYLAGVLRDADLQVAILRHPMPYGDLSKQVVQRFATLEDMDRHECTIEEMEEYEPHIRAGNLVFAGADYQRILDEAEKEADVILWDGGNNDGPFVEPDFLITLLDPLRPGDELDYFPGRWNFEQADALVMGKIDEARTGDLEMVRRNAKRHNPAATLYSGASPIRVDRPELIKGKRVLVVEDGPTITHGGMGYGAGYLAALRSGAAEIVDPRPFATGQIAAALARYAHVRETLPALGYGDEEIRDLQETIARADCDAVVIGTPIDLSRVLKIDKPVVRVTYRFEEVGGTPLADVVRERFTRAVVGTVSVSGKTHSPPI